MHSKIYRELLSSAVCVVRGEEQGADSVLRSLMTFGKKLLHSPADCVLMLR